MNKLNYDDFIKYVNETMISIYSKIDNDEKDFLEMLIKEFNRRCEITFKIEDYLKNSDLKNMLWGKEILKIIGDNDV
jgi:hypothetical protein